MKILQATSLGLFVMSWLLMSCSASSQPGSVAKTEEGTKGSPPSAVSAGKQKDVQTNNPVGAAGMRIEEPDGTILPQALPTTDATTMDAANFKEEPGETGDGVMVNTEGGFKSYLAIPEGSNEAIHVDVHEDDKYEQTKEQE